MHIYNKNIHKTLCILQIEYARKKSYNIDSSNERKWENGKQKTPQAKACGEFQRMDNHHNAEHSERFDKRNLNQVSGTWLRNKEGAGLAARLPAFNITRKTGKFKGE